MARSRPGFGGKSKKRDARRKTRRGRELKLESLESRQLLAAVTVSDDVVGTTPEIVGYNVAHFLPDSNTESWWQYAGVNGARLWASSTIVEGNDDNDIWGDGVTSEASFVARREDLRADPLNTEYINWPHFEDRYANKRTTGNITNLNYAMERLRANDVEILAMINRTVGNHPFADLDTDPETGYGDRWEQWQHYYAQAFYMSRHYDVEKFQIYNEPNHSSNTELTQEGYIERLQLASDAIHSAIEDVNQLYNKSLTAQVQGPVNSGGNKVFSNSGTGWGELVIDNRHTDLFGNPDPNNDIFQTYAYHLYNVGGSEAGSTLASIKEDIDTASGGEDIPVAITEFSVHSNSNFSELPETLDTPSKYKTFGSILSSLANNQPDELYVFKFGQTDDGDDGVKKNGTHYVDNNDEPHNVGGSTKSAEIVRLFAKGFKGSKDLLDEPDIVGSNIRMAASHDADEGLYYLFSTNVAGSSPNQLTIDLNDWNIAEGTVVTVEEVSETAHGEIVHQVPVPASGIITLEQAASTTWLFTIPDSGPYQEVLLTATDDAHVRSGVNVNTNYGTNDDLRAKNDPTNPNARSVAYLKFDLGSIDPSQIEQAVLQITGEDDRSDGVITHVYGLTDDSWDEETITWNSAPNLADSLGAVDGIEDNFVEGIGDSAKFLGHLTSTSDERLLQLDVTALIKDHGDAFASLLIAREVRFDGENVDDDLGSLQLASKERVGDAGPQLKLRLQADFGDAPSGYPTLAADDGARHLSGGPQLGSTRDVESDGQPSSNANGDEDDGVMFGRIIPGAEAGVNVDLQNASGALVDAWIDFNQNGNWNDPGEQILVSAAVTSGLQTLNYTAPAGASSGTTYARVRVSSDGGLSPIGQALKRRGRRLCRHDQWIH